MPTVRGTPGRADSPLRRIAIVLSVLPEPAANRLLGSLHPALRNRIRETARSLGEVEPWERQLALRSFAGSIRESESGGAGGASPASVPRVSFPAGGGAREIADEAHFGHAAYSASDPSAPSAAATATSPLGFLRNVSAETLVERLTGEHPQTVALVLASITPELAAAVLPKLPDGEREAAIGRLGRLDQIPDDAIAAIAEHLQERLADAAAPESRSAGQQALAAIFAQLRPPPQSSPSSATNAPQTWPAGHDSAIDPDRPPRPFPDAYPEPAASGSGKSPAARSPAGRSPAARSPAARSGPYGSGYRFGEEEPAADVTADEFSHRQAHEHLVTLDPAQLCRALGQVDTRQALLALCGIPADVADAVLELLPRRQAKDVRRQLASLGSIRLREIDAAKILVARVSLGTAEAEVSSPEPLAA